MTDTKTLAYINMYAVLGTLENLCELDDKAKEILSGLKKPVSVCFDVKHGPSATIKFTKSGCRMEDGVRDCDIYIPFSSCEKFNGVIDGTVTPVPLKGLTKIGFLLKTFTALTDRLSEVMQPSEEALKDRAFFELSTKLTFYTISVALSQIGNQDKIGQASASYMQFDTIDLAYDLFNGKVNSLECIGKGTVEIRGMLSMVDNMNRILDRVALYLA